MISNYYELLERLKETKELSMEEKVVITSLEVDLHEIMKRKLMDLRNETTGEKRFNMENILLSLSRMDDDYEKSTMIAELENMNEVSKVVGF